jgi:hypothetical protein
MVAVRRIALVDAYARVASVVDSVGSLRAIELLRIAAGPITLVHLWPFFVDAANDVVYSDRFYQPDASWYPEAFAGLYMVLLWSVIPASVALSLGLATRLAAAYTAGFVGYNLFLSSTHFWHNRMFLLVILIGTAVLPLGRVWSIDALIRARRGRPALSSDGMLWPVMLMRIEVVAVYLTSGISKLVDEDWWGGTVTRLRVVQWRAVAADNGVPEWVLDLMTTSGFHSYFAKAAVLAELIIGIGLLMHRTRVGVAWFAVVFHVGIEIVASVQVFSLIAIAALLLWVTPAASDRIVVVSRRTAGTRLLSHAIRWLDWTGRFRLTRSDDLGPALTLVDRHGEITYDAAAARMILSRLPVTFVLLGPLNLAGLRRLWDRRAGYMFDSTPPIKGE